VVADDYYPRDVVSAVYATATWLGGCHGWLGGSLDVTRRYCIKTAKPIILDHLVLVTPSF